MHLPRSGRRMNKTAIAFGTFDGVHRGHQEIINAMLGHELELSCKETLQNGHAVLKVADGLVLPAPGRYITEAEGRRLVCGVLPGGSIEPEEPFGEPKKLRFIGRIG